MVRCFVVLSAVFLMAFVFTGNASANDAIDNFIEDDFYVTDNVWEDTGVRTGMKIVLLPVTLTHDALKSVVIGIGPIGWGAGYVGKVTYNTVTDPVGSTVAVGEFVVDKTVDIGEVVVDSYTTDTFIEENLQAGGDIVTKSLIIAPALIFDAVRGTGNLIKNSLNE